MNKQGLKIKRLYSVYMYSRINYHEYFSATLIAYHRSINMMIFKKNLSKIINDNNELDLI